MKQEGRLYMVIILDGNDSTSMLHALFLKFSRRSPLGTQYPLYALSPFKVSMISATADQSFARIDTKSDQEC